MLNLSMLKLIKDLTEKSKGLRWGTEYLFLFLLTSLWEPFIIYHGEGGWMILEDHMIFKGTEDSRYIRISQSLDLGGRVNFIVPQPKSSDLPPLPRQ